MPIATVQRRHRFWVEWCGTWATTQSVIDSYVALGTVALTGLLVLTTAERPPGRTSFAASVTFRQESRAGGVTSALYWLRGPLVCGCLAACAVGPNYVRPKPPAGAEAPLVSFSPSAQSRAPPPDAWWQLYRDPGSRCSAPRGVCSELRPESRRGEPVRRSRDSRGRAFRTIAGRPKCPPAEPMGEMRTSI